MEELHSIIHFNSITGFYLGKEGNQGILVWSQHMQAAQPLLIHISQEYRDEAFQQFAATSTSPYPLAFISSGV